MSTALDDIDEQDSTFDFFSDDELPGTDRRTKTIALWGVAIVVAILAASVLLVRATDVGSPGPGNPTAAAQQWIDDVVAGRRPEAPKSCVGPAYTSAFVAVDGHPKVALGSPKRLADDHWTVTIDITSPRQSVPVHVERHAGSYVVC